MVINSSRGEHVFQLFWVILNYQFSQKLLEAIMLSNFSLCIRPWAKLLQVSLLLYGHGQKE
jgi:hypothetical protein